MGSFILKSDQTVLGLSSSVLCSLTWRQFGGKINKTWHRLKWCSVNCHFWEVSETHCGGSGGTTSDLL